MSKSLLSSGLVVATDPALCSRRQLLRSSKCSHARIRRWRRVQEGCCHSSQHLITPLSALSPIQPEIDDQGQQSASNTGEYRGEHFICGPVSGCGSELRWGTYLSH